MNCYIFEREYHESWIRDNIMDKTWDNVTDKIRSLTSWDNYIKDLVTVMDKGWVSFMDKSRDTFMDKIWDNVMDKLGQHH